MHLPVLSSLPRPLDNRTIYRHTATPPMRPLLDIVEDRPPTPPERQPGRRTRPDPHKTEENPSRFARLGPRAAMQHSAKSVPRCFTAPPKTPWNPSAGNHEGHEAPRRSLRREWRFVLRSPTCAS